MAAPPETAQASRDARIALALAPYLSREAACRGVLLAVSGGPDSTALLHASAQARGQVALAVATVDHGLRAESAAEAASVAALASRLGLPHRTLVWEAPERGAARARGARYRLLTAHAAALGARWLLTGHTRDDQAETVLMRLLSGSGPAGLAGMARERGLGSGIRLARPFLSLPKDDLLAYCAARRLPFVSDPSNGDSRYARARLRRLVPSLEAEGLSARRLCRLAERLARDDAALRNASERVFASILVPSGETGLVLDGARLRTEPEAIVLRVLDRATQTVAGALDTVVARRLERLERLVLDDLLPALTRGESVRRTLRGAVVEVGETGLVRIAPAPSRRNAFTKPRESAASTRVAEPPDLLGKNGTAAYIGGECREPARSDFLPLAAAVPNRDES